MELGNESKPRNDKFLGLFLVLSRDLSYHTVERTIKKLWKRDLQ